MKKYISEDAESELIEYIRAKGYEVVKIRPAPGAPAPLAMHADLQMCRLGVSDSAPVVIADFKERFTKRISNSTVGIADCENQSIKRDDVAVFVSSDDLTARYPGDVPFNAACTGKYFIHNLKYTSPELLAMARNKGMHLINVRQGYAKCSIVVVDENSIITYDDGIAKACTDRGSFLVMLATVESCEGIEKVCGNRSDFSAVTATGGSGRDFVETCREFCDARTEPECDNKAVKNVRDKLEVLKIRPGFVKLDGYDTGFIGGATGRLGDEIIFNGDITKHPDWDAIREFIEARNLHCKWFDWELTDIGSII